MKTRNLFPILLVAGLMAIAPVARGQTWTGGGPDSNIDDASNWDTLPAFDGSQTPTFASGGTVATINTNVSFYGLSFSAATAFTIASGGGTLTNGAGGITAANAFTYTIACPVEIAANQIWPINSGTSLTISGAIDDSGAGYGILKSLTGNLTLTGVNTYSGGTTLNAGTLSIGSDDALGAGVLTISGATTTLAPLADVTLPNDVALETIPTFSLGTNTLTFAGNITGAAINADPTLSSGGLTFTGTNFIAASSSSSAGLSFKITGTGTVLTLAGGSTTFSNVALYPSGGQILVSGGTHYFVGSLTNHAGINMAATMTITGGTVHTSWFSLGYGGAGAKSNTFNMDGGYFDTTTFPLGAGTLIFAYNTLAADVITLNLNGGTILTAGIQEIGSSAPVANNIINLNGGTLMASTNNLDFLSASGFGMTANVLTNGAVFDTAGFDITVTNALLDGGGSGGLTKNGAGTLDLSGVNTYTGPTAVGDGTLLVDGSIGGGAVSVNTGATLGGMGVVGGATTIQSGGTLAPGTLAFDTNWVASSVLGTLTVNNNLTLDSGADVLFQLNTTNALAANDYLVVTGTQNITASTLAVVNVGPALVAGDRFQLLSQPTSGFTTVNLPTGYVWTNNLAVDGSIAVVAVSTAPSPTNITYSAISGNQLVLDWPAGQGWQLQAQTNSLSTGLTTNWFNVTGATPPYTNSINPVNATVFYRLKY